MGLTTVATLTPQLEVTRVKAGPINYHTTTVGHLITIPTVVWATIISAGILILRRHLGVTPRILITDMIYVVTLGSVLMNTITNVNRG